MSSGRGRRRSRLPAEQEADAGLDSGDPKITDLTGRDTRNALSHRGTPDSALFKIPFGQNAVVVREGMVDAKNVPFVPQSGLSLGHSEPPMNPPVPSSSRYPHMCLVAPCHPMWPSSWTCLGVCSAYFVPLSSSSWVPSAAQTAAPEPSCCLLDFLILLFIAVLCATTHISCGSQSSGHSCSSFPPGLGMSWACRWKLDIPDVTL